MRHTVTWDTAASKKLTRLWLNSSNPQSITDAADQIDLVLTYHPERSTSSGHVR